VVVVVVVQCWPKWQYFCVVARARGESTTSTINIVGIGCHAKFTGCKTFFLLSFASAFIRGVKNV
jgi:hypothetical protein